VALWHGPRLASVHYKRALVGELRAVHEAIWEVEDALQAKEFGATFIDMGRSVYRSNDRRSALKQQINELLGSALCEQKVGLDRRLVHNRPDAARPPGMEWAGGSRGGRNGDQAQKVYTKERDR
jgi:hypothetical protein